MLLTFLWFGLVFLSLISDIFTGTPFNSGRAALSGAAVGLELALVFGGNPGESLPYIWAFQGISVAAGEIVICYTLGMLLTFALYRADLYKKLFPETRTA